VAGIVAMSSPCCCHVVAMSPSCRRDVVVMLSPCHRNVVAMSRPPLPIRPAMVPPVPTRNLCPHAYRMYLSKKDRKQDIVGQREEKKEKCPTSSFLSKVKQLALQLNPHLEYVTRMSTVRAKSWCKIDVSPCN